jgi:glycine oxidase
MQTLADHLLDQRVSWYSSTPVEQVNAHQILAKGKTYSFDWVIDTRGLGAKPQWSELRGVRGELIWLQAPEVNISRLVRLMHPRYRLYLVPRMKDNLYVIGATQIESDDTGPITLRSSLELLSAVYSLHPGFAEARVLESKTNCRPALNNNLPRIEYQPGLVKVNGLYRHGFLLAPSMAQEVLQWLEHQESYQSPYKQLIQQVA